MKTKLQKQKENTQRKTEQVRFSNFINTIIPAFQSKTGDSYRSMILFPYEPLLYALVTCGSDGDGGGGGDSKFKMCVSVCVGGRGRRRSNFDTPDVFRKHPMAPKLF